MSDMSGTQNSALIVGVTGVIGRGVADYLSSLGTWRITGLSRTPLEMADVEHVSADLLQANGLSSALSGLDHITHIFFCGFINASTQAEQVAPNLAMLQNLIEAGTPHMPKLERVLLNEGNKWYGSHLGPFKTPAKEDDARCPPPMFYHDQEDFLRAFAEDKPWSWVALRPHTVCGFSLGSPMNIMTAIGVYASLRKEQGLPLTFPGKPGAFEAVYQATDAYHLARAQVWAATADTAADEAFNITNGDFFRWCNVWPRLADFFGMEAGGVETVNLTKTMPGLKPMWEDLTRRHGLAPHAFEKLVAWPFADYVFGTDWDVMTSTTKIRQAGFHEVVDSEDMLVRILGEFRDKKIIP